MLWWHGPAACVLCGRCSCCLAVRLACVHHVLACRPYHLHPSTPVLVQRPHPRPGTPRCDAGPSLHTNRHACESSWLGMCMPRHLRACPPMVRSHAANPSCPAPPCFASGWKRPAHGSHGSLHGLASHDGAAERVQPSGHSAASVLSHLARLSAALGSRDAMYHLETGAANEHVPSNTDHYYLPLWQVRRQLPCCLRCCRCYLFAPVLPCNNLAAIVTWPFICRITLPVSLHPPFVLQRLILRSSYVLLCTIVACVVVSSAAGEKRATAALAPRQLRLNPRQPAMPGLRTGALPRCTSLNGSPLTYMHCSPSSTPLWGWWAPSPTGHVSTGLAALLPTTAGLMLPKTRAPQLSSSPPPSCAVSVGFPFLMYAIVSRPTTGSGCCC